MGNREVADRKWKTLGLSLPSRDIEKYFPVPFLNRETDFLMPANGQRLGVGVQLLPLQQHCLEQ